MAGSTVVGAADFAVARLPVARARLAAVAAHIVPPRPAPRVGLRDLAVTLIALGQAGIRIDRQRAAVRKLRATANGTPSRQALREVFVPA